MGDCPAVIEEPPVAATDTHHSVCCDQAIFTSIRSATGQGYRLIAASTGVHPDEKVEITRRSASHGSLCETNTDPIGLASYRLNTGRHCITYCCHAGCEHTARGGQRVYSHMVLLDPASYRLFNSNPVCVHAVLADVVTKNGPLLKQPVRLEPLSLNIPSLTATPKERSYRGAFNWVLAVAAQLLAGRRFIFVGAQNPLLLLRWALHWLPRDIRESVDVSSGLKFSPARGMQLVLLPKADAHLRSLIAGQGVELLGADVEPPAYPMAFDPWFRLLSRWWQEGRFTDLIRLTSNVCADAIAGMSSRN